MSTSNTILESSPAAAPFKVRLEPYLVESICELARLVRDKGNANSDISGLLFGKVENGLRSAEALKSFVDMGSHSELARRQRWEKAYKTTADEAKNDLELSQLEIVGWFSFRTGSGLLSSDVYFHNQHFKRPEDIAIIIWREGPSQITTEVYSKSDNDILTAEDYRWGSVRLSADIRHMRESVELAMRMKLNDDSYLRTYERNDSVSPLDAWKQRAEALSDRLFGFLHRGEDDLQLAKVKGLLGDGRLPGRSKPTIDAIDPLPNPQAYFNPYSDSAAARNRVSFESTLKAAAATAAAAPAPALSSSAWPTATGSTSGFATAPARIPEYHYTDSNLPMTLAPTQSLDFAQQIGRSPRSGRIAGNEISGLPVLLRPHIARKVSPWPWALGIFLVCSGLVFGFLAVGGMQSGGFQSLFSSGSLNLGVHNEDDRLRLSWNQRNHNVASASDATLQILDGRTSRDIHLDGRQVADGSVLYRPLTNDVTFRLEVHGEQGTTSGSVRVLDGLAGHQSTLDVSSPSQTAAAAADANLPTALPDSAASLPVTTVPTADPLTAYVPSAYPLPPVRTPVLPKSSASPRSASPRYETPETIATPPAEQTTSPATGGATINGWDPAPVSRLKTSRAKTTSVNGTNFIAPRPLTQVMPNVRSIPAGTLPVRTRVAVQVKIDSAGRVSSARVLSAGLDGKVSTAAVAAARQWLFDPAQSNGRYISSQHTIVFEFPAR